MLRTAAVTATLAGNSGRSHLLACTAHMPRRGLPGWRALHRELGLAGPCWASGDRGCATPSRAAISTTSPEPVLPFPSGLTWAGDWIPGPQASGSLETLSFSVDYPAGGVLQPSPRRGPWVRPRGLSSRICKKTTKSTRFAFSFPYPPSPSPAQSSVVDSVPPQPGAKAISPHRHWRVDAIIPHTYMQCSRWPLTRASSLRRALYCCLPPTFPPTFPTFPLGFPMRASHLPVRRRLPSFAFKSCFL